jgi:hypothetical protein
MNESSTSELTELHSTWFLPVNCGILTERALLSAWLGSEGRYSYLAMQAPTQRKNCHNARQFVEPAKPLCNEHPSGPLFLAHVRADLWKCNRPVVPCGILRRSAQCLSPDCTDWYPRKYKCSWSLLRQPQNPASVTEQVSSGFSASWVVLRRCLIPPVILIQASRYFLQSPQAIAGMYLETDDDHFLSRPFRDIQPFILWRHGLTGIPAVQDMAWSGWSKVGTGHPPILCWHLTWVPAVHDTKPFTSHGLVEVPSVQDIHPFPDDSLTGVPAV